VANGRKPQTPAPPMKKRSVTLQGHATSVTLEDEFWEQLVKIATERKQSIASLIDEIDEDRLQTTKGGLSSALRVYILNHLLAKDIH
jgi:predicted DNA-binding ribbon-helix-helix protein